MNSLHVHCKLTLFFQSTPDDVQISQSLGVSKFRPACQISELEEAEEILVT